MKKTFQTKVPGRWNRWLDRLDALGAVRFTLTLYAVRWVVLLPMLGVLFIVGPSSAARQAAQAHAETDLSVRAFQLLLAAPVVETLAECYAPYLILLLFFGSRRNISWKRPWFFVWISALIMVLVHPLHWTIIIPAAVTGVFLAYTYAHFAPKSLGLAFLATTIFHSGINLVGFVSFWLSR